MMEKITDTLRKDWLLILLIASCFILGAYLYPYLPAKVPSHWNINGRVDGYTSKFWGVYGLPVLNVGLYLLFIVLPLIDPRKKNYDRFSPTYRFLRYLMHIFFIGLYIFTLMSALGTIVNPGLYVQVGISLLFLLIGNVMGRVKHNYFVGIKTPWTLASEEVWRKTHRMAGPLWVAGGIAGIITAFINYDLAGKIFFVILITIVVLPTVYSYIAYHNIMKHI